jgi:sucrose-6-phosphate hydrolase SacC (GH32 family)
LQILVDRTLIEIFLNDGESFMPIGVTPDDDNKSLKVFSKGGSAHIEELTVYEMKSIWPQ